MLIMWKASLWRVSLYLPNSYQFILKWYMENLIHGEFECLSQGLICNSWCHKIHIQCLSVMSENLKLKCLMFTSITHIYYFEKHPKFQAGRSVVQVFVCLFVLLLILNIPSLQVVTKPSLSYPKGNNEFTTCSSVSLPH